LPPEALPASLRRIDESAERAGRDPSTIRRVYNLMGRVQSEHDERFEGPVSYWIEELTGLVEIGMDTFVFWPAGEDPLGQIEAFASEVAPGVRDATAR
jgi:hypothetical protein